jgi:hypothetical protein
MVGDTVQDVNQAVHNVAMATWVARTVFNRIAFSPAVRRITFHTERGESRRRRPGAPSMR